MCVRGACVCRSEADFKNLPQWLFHLFFKVGSSHQIPIWLVFLVTLLQQSQFLLRLELQLSCHSHQTFSWVLGIQTQSFCLHDKYFNYPVIFLVLYFFIYFAVKGQVVHTFDVVAKKFLPRPKLWSPSTIFSSSHFTVAHIHVFTRFQIDFCIQYKIVT